MGHFRTYSICHPQGTGFGVRKGEVGFGVVKFLFRKAFTNFDFHVFNYFCSFSSSSSSSSLSLSLSLSLLSSSSSSLSLSLSSSSLLVQL